MHRTQVNKASRTMMETHEQKLGSNHTCWLQLFDVDDLDGINDIFFSVDAAMHGTEGATEEYF